MIPPFSFYLVPAKAFKIKVVAIKAEQNKLDDVISVNVRDSWKRKGKQEQNAKHEGRRYKEKCSKEMALERFFIVETLFWLS